MKGNRVAAVLVLLMVCMGAVQLPWGGVEGDQTGDGGAFSPMGGEPVWTDPLDDSSHVYMADRIDVTGGEARLASGETQGWFASSVITCPAGYRYDLVYIEEATPGASQVLVSILDATREASVVGFANETIAPHVKVGASDHSVFDISPTTYPAIRIQVNLVASGTDLPRVLSWSLFYVPINEWRDDFLGTAKLSRSRGLNISGGDASVDLSRPASGGASEVLPPIAVPSADDGNNGTFTMFMADPTLTTYEDAVAAEGKGSYGLKFEDVNADGFLDLISANTKYQNNDVDSQIMWGDGTEQWSSSRATDLRMSSGERATTGDFNGDGETDVAITSRASQTACVWLNNGGGAFDYQPDLTITGNEWIKLAAGDINDDGYDDLALVGWTHGVWAWYGGPSGPDATPDLKLEGGGTGWYWDVTIMDIDGDGYLDLVMATDVDMKADVYMGGPSGPDTTADYSFSASVGLEECGAGDVNGDGYVDIVLQGNGALTIVEGTATGWSYSKRHDISGITGTGQLEVADLDLDGYTDIVLSTDAAFMVFFGGQTWPTTPDVRKAGIAAGKDVAIARSRWALADHLVGTLVTELITVPPDMKWDVAYLTGSVPRNTSVMVSVLGSSGKAISGYADLPAMDVDLSGITLETTIKVKVTLISDSNATTPVLDRLTVKWMDKGMWRDEFHGAAKVERALNLGVMGGELARAVATGPAPQLLLTGLKGQTGYNVKPSAYVDGGGLDYLSLPPIPFESAGVSAADAADVDGDGFMDVAFAVRQTGDTAYETQSPLFLGSAVGWRAAPEFKFPTTGAEDVLLRDVNGDGNVDVVFAQRYDGTGYRVNSTLFWGKAGGGWNSTPDVQFFTNGASGAVAVDMNGDGALDLAFACYRDATSTSTDSMVFLQAATGFCGTVPSYKLPTKGARAVAAGDVNGDGRMDLAFANSIMGGSAVIDSFVYWGKSGGGFETTPKGLRTSGAEDVELADVDGDGDLDAVFANMLDNALNHHVSSYVYLNAGSGTFSSTPDVRLPTTGAVAVTVADLDGTGRKDLVFACQYNGSSYDVPSVAYLGGASGWSSTPDIVLPTVGASDVLVGHLVTEGHGGYLSTAIAPEDWQNTGTFHTLRYTSSLGSQQSGEVRLVDAQTWDTLAKTALQPGTHEWLVKDLFWVKEHHSVRVVIDATGLGQPGEFSVDDLWLNWTKRVKEPPRVLGLEVATSPLLRLDTSPLRLEVTDEYDPPDKLAVTIEHRLNGTTGSWSTTMLGAPAFVDGRWTVAVRPRADAPLGMYDFRVTVRDSDMKVQGPVEFPNVLEVRNNLPTAPEVRIMPATPTTGVSIRAEMVMPATDRESPITYRYAWYEDGVLQGALTEDTVSSALTAKGQNWSVEVRAYDGVELGPAGGAWVVIANAPPGVGQPLPSPELLEDTEDSQWLDLSVGFADPDGDALAYTLASAPGHIQVTIGPDGRVTLRPEANWSGQESATFVASDGELSASQTVLITVTPVDDAPWFTTVDGKPVTTGPVRFDVPQGELLVIQVGATDIEGDALVFSVNTTAVEVDEATGEMSFRPGNDAVGKLRFALTMREADNPDVRVRLDFEITVVNVNDPMDEPRITNPRTGDKFTANQTFSLISSCTDPDTVYGQALNFSWWWNGTNLIGYGSSLTCQLTSAGNYTITLRVSDGEFTKEASVGIVIEPRDTGTPPPPPPPDEPGQQGSGVAGMIGVLVALVIVGGVVYLVMSRRRAASLEEQDEADDRREAFTQMAVAVKESAEQLEREVAESKAAKPVDASKVVIETRGPGGEVTQATAAEMSTLTMAPKETEAPSEDVARLFEDVGTAEPQVSEEEQERLRVENLKRKYQTAISRLPYGIPSPTLKDKDWPWLASALATGEKKTLPDGRETTRIEGCWYYSDVKDASSFLKEHGKTPKAEVMRPAASAAAAAAPKLDRATMLAKLEERLVMGEISEETYKRLREKYEGK